MTASMKSRWEITLPPAFLIQSGACQASAKRTCSAPIRDARLDQSDKLNSFGLAAGDVISAIQNQNAQVPVGQIGDKPAVEGQQLNVVMQGERLCAPFRV